MRALQNEIDENEKSGILKKKYHHVSKVKKKGTKGNSRSRSKGTKSIVIQGSPDKAGK